MMTLRKPALLFLELGNDNRWRRKAVDSATGKAPCEATDLAALAK